MHAYLNWFKTCTIVICIVRSSSYIETAFYSRNVYSIYCQTIWIILIYAHAWPPSLGSLTHRVFVFAFWLKGVKFKGHIHDNKTMIHWLMLKPISRSFFIVLTYFAVLLSVCKFSFLFNTMKWLKLKPFSVQPFKIDGLTLVLMTITSKLWVFRMRVECAYLL